MNSFKMFAVITLVLSVLTSTSAFARAKPVCNYAGGEVILTGAIPESFQIHRATSVVMTVVFLVTALKSPFNPTLAVMAMDISTVRVLSRLRLPAYSCRALKNRMQNLAT